MAMNRNPRPLPQLRAEAVRTLKKYAKSDPSQRTAILRDLAETLVEARAHFTRPDGSTDWKGRSYAYRTFVRDIYDRANIDRDESVSIQASTRYHIGEVLRETLSEDDLVEYGLQAPSPKVRARDRRATRTATLSALTARDFAGGSLFALVAANNLLRGLDADQLAGLDGREADVADEVLRELERRAEQLRGVVRGPKV